MYMCIELIKLNETHGLNNWLDRASLFGFSNDRDQLIIRNIKALGDLFNLGKEHSFYNWNTFHEPSGEYKSYVVVFCDDLDVLKTFYYTELFRDYVESTNQLCDIYGWEYKLTRLVPNPVLKTLDLENLNFEVIDSLWDKTMPIFAPLHKVF